MAQGNQIQTKRTSTSQPEWHNNRKPLRQAVLHHKCLLWDETSLCKCSEQRVIVLHKPMRINSFRDTVTQPQVVHCANGNNSAARGTTAPLPTVATPTPAATQAPGTVATCSRNSTANSGNNSGTGNMQPTPGAAPAAPATAVADPAE